MADEPSCSKDLSKSNKPFCNGSKDVNNFDLSSLAHGQLNQRDLLKLLSCLEGELQARDIVIATLKAEKAKHLLQQARYGKLGLRDPFTALQRDSFAVVDRATTDAGSNETDISQIYESQLTHLEKLIATQRKAHQRAKQVLAAAERRHARTVRELEEEKQKRANDTAQGDDVCMMLEKERERLQHEIENFRSDHEKTEADLQKLRTTLEEEKERHKQIVLYLLQERRHLLLRMTEERKSHRNEAAGSMKTENGQLEEATATAEIERLKGELDTYRTRYEEEHKKRIGLEASMKSLEEDLNLIRQTILAKSKQSGQEEVPARSTTADNFTSGSKTVKLQRRSGCDGNHKQQQHVTQEKRTPPTAHPSSVQICSSGGSSSHGPEVRYQILARSAQTSSDAVATRMPLPVNLSQNANAQQFGPCPNPGRFQSPGSNGQGQRSRYIPGVVDKSMTGNYSAATIFNQTSPPPPSVPNGAMLPPPFNPSLMSALGNNGASVISYRMPVEQFSVYGPAGMMAVRNTITVPPTQVRPTTKRVSLSMRGSSGSGSGSSSGSDLSSAVQHQSANSKFTSNVPSMVVRRPSSTTVISPVLPQPNIAPPSYSAAVHYSSMREHWGYSAVPSFDSRNVPSYRGTLNGFERIDVTTAIPSAETALSSSKAVENLTRKKPTAAGTNKQVLKFYGSKTDVNWQTFNGSTALLIACDHGYFEIVKLLVDSGANPNLTTTDLMHPLLAAVRAGSVDCVQYLLEHGADVELGCWNKWTALHEAVVSGNLNITQLLLSYGANMFAEDDEGMNSALIACHYGRYECLAMLMENCKDSFTLANSRSYDGTSCVYFAVQDGFDNCLKLLLEYKADVNLCTKENVHPLIPAVRNGYTRCVCLMLPYIDQKRLFYSSTDPVLVAVEECRLSMLEFLLKNGFPCDRRTEYNSDMVAPIYLYLQALLTKVYLTPLGCAVFRLNKDAVKLLLDYHAEPVFSTGKTQNPLLLAILKRRLPEILNEFLLHDVPLNRRTVGSLCHVPDAMLIAIHPLFRSQLIRMLKCNLQPHLERWCGCRDPVEYTLLTELISLLLDREVFDLIILLSNFVASIPNCCGKWRAAVGKYWTDLEPFVEITVVGFIQVISDQPSSDLSFIQHVLSLLQSECDLKLASSYAVAVVSLETIRKRLYERISFTALNLPEYSFENGEPLALTWCSSVGVSPATLSLRIRFQCEFDLYDYEKRSEGECTRPDAEMQLSQLVKGFEESSFFLNATGSSLVVREEDAAWTVIGFPHVYTLFELWKLVNDESGLKRSDLNFLANVMDFRLLRNRSAPTIDESRAIDCVPVVQRQILDFTVYKIPINLNVVYIANVEERLLELLPKLKLAVIHQLRLAQKCFLKYSDLKAKRFVVPQSYLFKLPDRPNFLSVVYPRDSKESELADERMEMNRLWNMATNRAYFMKSSEYLFPCECLYIRNIHEFVGSSGITGGIVCTVQGSYEYRHYMQDGYDDKGWGCAYRSLQTIWSWLLINGYVTQPVPSHKDIQQMLADCGDKDQKFVGTKQWIGSFELSCCLNHALNITSKFLSLSNGAELDSKARQLILHFENGGSPVMIGGGAYAYTILGVHFDEVTGDARFLVLDPHYTGPEDIKTIIDKGWCGWKRSSFWQEDNFYNLLLPITPEAV